MDSYEKEMQRILYGGTTTSKKRIVLTPKERLHVWEHPTQYGRKCNICSGRITKLSELEIDHTHPYSKSGTKMNLAHRDCNRMKGSKGLRHIQKKMGFKHSKRKTRSDKGKKKRKINNPYGIKLPKGGLWG